MVTLGLYRTDKGLEILTCFCDDDYEFLFSIKEVSFVIV
jgi:hypothetical protein